MKIGIVTAQFNREITERLEDGAKKALTDAGVKIDPSVCVLVPGAFEVPLAAKYLLEKKGMDGVVALGAVIQGDTKHFDFVCNAVERGCTQVSLETMKPVGFGILTTYTDEQALARCAPDKTNKGYETAQTVMEMVKLLQK